MDAQVRCIDQAALDDVGEVAAHVLEGHPGHDGETKLAKAPGWPTRPLTLCALNPNPQGVGMDVVALGRFTSLLASVS